MAEGNSARSLGCVAAAILLPGALIGLFIYGRLTRPEPSAPVVATAPARPVPSFAGYRCTQDCSGHEAGYVWAEEHGIMDSDSCPEDDGQSFMEGCVAYTEVADDSPYVDRP